MKFKDDSLTIVVEDITLMTYLDDEPVPSFDVLAFGDEVGFRLMILSCYLSRQLFVSLHSNKRLQTTDPASLERPVILAVIVLQ